MSKASQKRATSSICQAPSEKNIPSQSVR